MYVFRDMVQFVKKYHPTYYIFDFKKVCFPELADKNIFDTCYIYVPIGRVGRETVYIYEICGHGQKNNVSYLKKRILLFDSEYLYVILSGVFLLIYIVQGIK